jgi:catechol 2,3-dioxygenase-like lactoylglutathione lyase family enzyme
VPIDHVNLPVSDLEASRAFYTAALEPVGYKLVYDAEASLGFGRGDGGDDDEPFALRGGVAPYAWSHVASTATGEAQVDAFHAAAVAAGGTDNGRRASVPTAAATTRRSCSTRMVSSQH